MNEKEHLKLLADEAKDTVNMFSSHGKSGREKRTWAAFLRCLGVLFNPRELETSKDEPRQWAGIFIWSQGFGATGCKDLNVMIDL